MYLVTLRKDVILEFDSLSPNLTNSVVSSLSLDYLVFSWRKCRWPPIEGVEALHAQLRLAAKIESSVQMRLVKHFTSCPIDLKGRCFWFLVLEM